MMDPLLRARLEQAAVDNGFDTEIPTEGAWLGFASTQAPLRVWLTALVDGLYLLAVSQHNVAAALVNEGALFKSPLPSGACAARGVLDLPSLHRLARRAFQLSKTLPDELLHRFQARVAGLPRTTEAERLVVQRVGQDLFREGLLEYWEGRCAVTGLAVPELLRASHIKPWAVSEDHERLDAFNGLLLAPNLDAAFDKGFVTFGDDGALVCGPRLAAGDRERLGLVGVLRVRGLTERHRVYLGWHREFVFRRE